MSLALGVRATLRNGLLSLSATLLVTGVVVLAMVGRAPSAYAAQPAVGLGTATSFAVLAGSTVTNTGPSMITGDLGVSPGAAAVGFPPGLVTGEIHAADAVALQAKDDLTTAYNDAAGRSPVVDKTAQDLGGQTLVPGVYNASSAMALTGTVTLDAEGDPSAVFVFQAGSTLTTASSSQVALLGGAQACNVFWQVGSSATLGTSSTMVGTVMALTSITATTNATIQGRLLARNGAVTLDSNTITRPSCASAPPTDTPDTPTDTPADTPTDTSPTGTPGPAVPPAGDGSPDDGTTGGSGNPPWVPEGHPETGRTPIVSDTTTGGLWSGGALCLMGVVLGLAATGRRTAVRPE